MKSLVPSSFYIDEVYWVHRGGYLLKGAEFGLLTTSHVLITRKEYPSLGMWARDNSWGLIICLVK